jgi:hypothetical protein
MKKIIFSLLLIAGVALSQGAQAQKHHKSFRYYPEANVYYNNTTHQYAYSDNGNWAYRKTLPSDLTINRRGYVTVYGDEDDIWRENQAHREKYKDWDKKRKGKDRNKRD